MKAIWLALLVASAALAGCTSEDAPVTDDVGIALERPRMPTDPLPEGDDHDHSDASQHQFFWNYELSAFDPILSSVATNGGLHAMDVRGDTLFGAVYGSHITGGDGGLVLWDISDPEQPVQTGRFPIPGKVGGDRSVEATPDGNFAVVGVEALTCFGQVNPFGGVTAYLFDTSDKANPVPVDIVTVTGQTLGSPTATFPTIGTHSVTIHRFGADENGEGGTDYAFLSGQIMRIDRDNGKLVREGLMTVGHDMYLRDTPWGDTWAMVANGGRSFVLYNMTDPTAPEEIGVWDFDRGDTREGGVKYYFHTADAVFFDNQTLIVLTSEDAGGVVSPFWILDATVPSEMKMIGNWTNPGGHMAGDLAYSLHNPRFHDDGIFSLSFYHGGIWQFDFREPAWRADPPVIAYAVYAEDAGAVIRDPVEAAVQEAVCGLGTGGPAPGVAFPYRPYTLDVEVGPDGILYAGDVTGGLYTFKPTADHPVYGHLYS